MRIVVIPDLQVKPGSDLSHLDHIAQYIVDKKPDWLIDLGDFADMPSLSSYDVGKKSFEGRRYKDDIDAANEGLERLNAPIIKEQERLKRRRQKEWKLQKKVTRGNHDWDRIERAIESDRKLEGLISVDDLQYGKYGYDVHPFLQVAVVEGIAFSHFFCSGIMGRPVTTSRALLTKKHMSCIAGHQPGYDVATDHRADGRRITAIIAGSAYPEDLPYLNDQTNKHWRGILMLNEVSDGSFDEMKVSLNFLRERYAR
jgi:hypothetical protein